MIRVQRTRDEVTRGPLQCLGATPRSRRAARFDELITTDGRCPGGGSGRGPRPFGEIDLRNAPEIAFFRRRGRIPLRAIRAPRARASRRAPFWGLRCVRCGGRSRCGPNRLSPSPNPRRRSALEQHPPAHTAGAEAASAPASWRAWCANLPSTACASTPRPPARPACACATSPSTRTSRSCASVPSTRTSMRSVVSSVTASAPKDKISKMRRSTKIYYQCVRFVPRKCV